MNIEENIKLFQQYQKSNKLEKASEMVDAIADTLKTDGRTVLCANHILEFYLFEYYFKTRDYEAVRYPMHRMYHSLAKKYMERMHFDKAYENGVFDRLLTTNLVYQTPDLLSRPYYISVDLSKYIALIIDNLNHDASLSELLSPTKRINRLLEAYRNGDR